MKKDPARLEHAIRAEAKAKSLIEKIQDLDRIPAEDYLRHHPPDVETIVGLCWLHQRHASQARRPNNLNAEVKNILRTDPDASPQEVLYSLESRLAELDDWLIEVDKEEGIVQWRTKTGKEKETSETMLANIISRVRNEIKKK